MKKQTTWTTKTGAQVTVTAELVTSKLMDADGDKITVPCCERRVSVRVDGHGEQGDWVRQLPEPIRKPDGTVYVAKVGQLALTQDQADTINGLRAEVEQAPEWQAHQTKIEANRRALAKLDSDRRASGYCPKCGSYCDGDCEAN